MSYLELFFLHLLYVWEILIFCTGKSKVHLRSFGILDSMLILFIFSSCASIKKKKKSLVRSKMSSDVKVLHLWRKSVFCLTEISAFIQKIPVIRNTSYSSEVPQPFASAPSQHLTHPASGRSQGPETQASSPAWWADPTRSASAYAQWYSPAAG